MNRVFTTTGFDKRWRKLSFDEAEWIRKCIDGLKCSVSGKRLIGSWLWEKKYHNKRSYFILKEKNILVVRFGRKKHQQKMIDNIKERSERFFLLLDEFSAR